LQDHPPTHDLIHRLDRMLRAAYVRLMNAPRHIAVLGQDLPLLRTGLLARALLCA
jgi:hypothetical protein